MKSKLGLLLCSFFSLTCLANGSTDLVTAASQTLLPNPFLVYQGGKSIKKKWLPTINHYTSNPGCYIACYSHDAKGSIYPIGDNIYVHGQVRVPGTYVNRICFPKGYEGKDISSVKTFSNLCRRDIKTCKGIDCWAGGDTGGWFGITP